MVPLLLALLVMLAAATFSLYRVQKNTIEFGGKSKLEAVQELFQEELKENARLLNGLLDFIKKDEVLQNAWLVRDRQALLDHAASTFEEIRTRYDVTHFYFIDPERVCFLRMHKPDRYGDTIDRFTLDQAVREGKPVYGIELGPFGTLTLRTVHPWRVGGKLAGYLELGGEIEHITAELSKILNAEVVMTIDKKYLNRTSGEGGLKFLKRS